MSVTGHMEGGQQTDRPLILSPSDRDSVRKLDAVSKGDLLSQSSRRRPPSEARSGAFSPRSGKESQVDPF